jgi:phosphopantothenoylcysteine decarboxylase/phosphopantothenate--cysteine ligase
MHAEMWTHETVRENVATLRRRGVTFVGPESGPLASGEVGLGRLADPQEIAEAVAGAAGDGPRDYLGRTVLVSAGPTWEPIDPVRFLGNRSSGKMGFAIAGEAARRGARAVLVSGPVYLETPVGVERIDVGTALEMNEALSARAAAADLVVMTAAVADFRAGAVAAAKIKKSRGVPRLELVANPDILAGLAEVAPAALRVGFAAETEPSESEAYAKLARKRADFLVWNDVAADGVGFGADDNEVTVYRPNGDPIFLSRRPKREIAALLLNHFREALDERARQPERAVP